MRAALYVVTLLGVTAIVFACESAWGPGADRHYKRLINWDSVGSNVRRHFTNEAALQAAKQRYTEGAIDFLNVITAQAQLLQSENDLADSRPLTCTRDRIPMAS
jgi:hypothetical protein